MLKAGDIVQISYTGIETGSGRVFDTTSEARAKEAGLHQEGAKHAPLIVVLGKKELIKGLEDELLKMGVGEQKKILVEPKLAYGERKADFIRVVPLQNFRENKMSPYPGMVIEAAGMHGRVQAVSGGRVRVDFNHPLAGKTLEFEVKIERIVSDTKEKVSALFEKVFPHLEEKGMKVSVRGAEAEITLEKGLGLRGEHAEAIKKAFEKMVTENSPEIKAVKIIEPVAEEAEGNPAEKAPEQAQERAAEKAAEMHQETPGKKKAKARQKKEK